MTPTTRQAIAALPMFLVQIVTSIADLERIRRNRLLDLARYYGGRRGHVCPACLREFRKEGGCPRCGEPLLPASALAGRWEHVEA